eukprot:jgi/Ulvmu1/8390/UM042_0097.1
MKTAYCNIVSRRQVVRRQVVQKDKQETKEVLAKLDAQREEQVEKTWHKVSAAFSKIFATLLPGTEARLEPPPPQKAATSWMDSKLELPPAVSGTTACLSSAVATAHC